MAVAAATIFAGVSAAAKVGGAIAGGVRAGKQQRRAERKARTLEAQMKSLESKRQKVINPFEGVTDLSSMIFDTSDELIGIKLANKDDDILLSSKNGKCLRFPLEKLRLFSGLNSSGVRGIKLEKNNYVISQAILKHSKIDMSIRQDYLRAASENRKNTSILSSEFEELNKNEEFLLALTTNGYGKRSSAYEYRISNRGGKGITGIITSEKNGEVLDCFVINEDDQIILVTDKGQIIRINVNQIRIAGRSTKGVSVFKIPEGDSIVSVSRIPEIET